MRYLVVGERFREKDLMSKFQCTQTHRCNAQDAGTNTEKGTQNDQGICTYDRCYSMNTEF